MKQNELISAKISQFPLPGRLTVGQMALDHLIHVRIVAGQPVYAPEVTRVPQIARIILYFLPVQL